MRKNSLPKPFLVIAAFFFCLTGRSQQDHLIKLALSDISNFEVMSFFNEGNKMPKSFSVFDTTTYWPPKRFYLEGVDRRAAEWSRDEHHPYNFVYLFKDTALNKIFSIAEKKALSEKAAGLKSRKIRINTPIASTVRSFRSIQSGFIVWVTDPVYSTDSTYAFIDFTILEKRHKHQEMNEAYHSMVCVVYRKEKGQWKKWKLKKHVIL